MIFFIEVNPNYFPIKKIMLAFYFLYISAGKNDKTDTQSQEKNGVRCVKVSPDGQHLASGDRMGNIR